MLFYLTFFFTYSVQFFAFHVLVYPLQKYEFPCSDLLVLISWFLFLKGASCQIGRTLLTQI